MLVKFAKGLASALHSNPILLNFLPPHQA